MSEENPCTTAVLITNPVNTHVKDPKRVEAGRRLAKIVRRQNLGSARNVKQ
jgi:hypothetical protein